MWTPYRLVKVKIICRKVMFGLCCSSSCVLWTLFCPASLLLVWFSGSVRQHSDHPLLHESHLLTHMEPPLYPSHTNTVSCVPWQSLLRLSCVLGKGESWWNMWTIYECSFFCKLLTMTSHQTGKALIFRKQFGPQISLQYSMERWQPDQW